MDRSILEAAEWVWRCPETGNALVVLDVHPIHTVSVPNDMVVCADLDAGRTVVRQLQELTERVRRAEEEDYGYSWCDDADSEIVEHVVNSIPPEDDDWLDGDRGDR